MNGHQNVKSVGDSSQSWNVLSCPGELIQPLTAAPATSAWDQHSPMNQRIEIAIDAFSSWLSTKDLTMPLLRASASHRTKTSKIFSTIQKELPIHVILQIYVHLVSNAYIYILWVHIGTTYSRIIHTCQNIRTNTQYIHTVIKLVHTSHHSSILAI